MPWRYYSLALSITHLSERWSENHFSEWSTCQEFWGDISAHRGPSQGLLPAQPVARTHGLGATTLPGHALRSDSCSSHFLGNATRTACIVSPIFFSFSVARRGTWSSPGQGVDPSHRCSLCCSSSGNTRPLTHCARPGIEPASQCSRDATAADSLAPQRALQTL